jgi:hypothetical protein
LPLGFSGRAGQHLPDHHVAASSSQVDLRVCAFPAWVLCQGLLARYDAANPGDAGSPLCWGQRTDARAGTAVPLDFSGGASIAWG